LKEAWEILAASETGSESVSFPGTSIAHGFKTAYGYDTLNNLTTVSQGVQTRTFSYSSLSRLLSAANPESGTIEYEYDPNGNLTEKTDARSIVTTYTYDELNRVTARDYSDTTPDVDYTYGTSAPKVGKLVKVESSVSTTEYTGFDILGRVTAHKQTTDGQSYTTGYVYNLSGALIEQTYPSGRVVKNVLDNNGDLSLVQSKKNSAYGFFTYAKSFTYNPAGAVTSMQLGNGRWESTQFNSRLQPTQIALGVTQGATNLLDLDYSYGTTANNGNVLSQTITVPTVGINTGFSAVQNYNYDSLNRLKDATEMLTPTGGSATQSWKQTFTFDRYGNRNFDEANTAFAGFDKLCNNNTELCADLRKRLNPSINASNNRLSTSDDYDFDESGNTTADADDRTFIYDAENKQVEVRDSQQNVIGQYWYDGDGRRVKKHVPATGEVTIFVYDASGRLIGEYSTEVQPSQDAKTQYLTADHLGTPRINTDGSGQVISRHDYHPFGEEVSRSGYGSDTIRKQFTGYERDGETGLEFAQARMYASAVGRFTAADPLLSSLEPDDPQSMNRYAYCGNNPLNFIDPTGLWRWSLAMGGNASDDDLEQRIRDLENDESLDEAARADAIANINNMLFNRQQFRDALSLARLMVDRGTFANASEYLEATAAVNSYGAEGDGNNVVIGLRNDNSNPAFTSVEGQNVIVGFTPSALGSKGTALNIIHEGVHVTQAQRYLAGGSNTSRLDADSAAYRVTIASWAAINNARAAAGQDVSTATLDYVGVRVWQQNITSVDMQTGLNSVLQRIGYADAKNRPTVSGAAPSFAQPTGQRRLYR